MMNSFDDDLPHPSDPRPPETRSAEAAPLEQPSPPLDSNPIVSTPAASAPQYTAKPLPEDLRIPWSWPHFIIFLFFTVTSFIVIQTALAIHYAPEQHLNEKQLEQYLLNKPQFLFGSNLIWYAAIFLFLYVTLAVLRGSPFWSSLGWKSFRSSLFPTRKAWSFFLSGCGLALFVAIASSRIDTKKDMPIQELFKNRTTALLLMAMAVFIAPLVEETIFRGYLYPLFAKSFGILPGVLVTGFLFGLMHGSQLGWTWQIVALLIVVGVIFTSARAYTGTVLASFLLHLGYNSTIAFTTILGTHGFTRMPGPH